MLCPACNYIRRPEDSAPEWQCPACGKAYAKAAAAEKQHSSEEASKKITTERAQRRSFFSGFGWVLLLLLGVGGGFFYWTRLIMDDSTTGHIDRHNELGSYFSAGNESSSPPLLVNEFNCEFGGFGTGRAQVKVTNVSNRGMNVGVSVHVSNLDGSHYQKTGGSMFFLPANDTSSFEVPISYHWDDEEVECILKGFTTMNGIVVPYEDETF